MKKYFIIISCILLCIFCTAGCNNKDKITEATMNIEYDDGKKIYDGTEIHTYRIEEGKKGVVSIKIDKDAGKIDVDVYRTDDNEKYEYKGRDLDSCTFEVILPHTGEYKLLFTCDDFVGEYGVTYSNQEK